MKSLSFRRLVNAIPHFNENARPQNRATFEKWGSREQEKTFKSFKGRYHYLAGGTATGIKLFERF